MFKRQLASILAKLASQFPVVTIIGPRQSGKTTLAQSTFSHTAYVNLEALDVQEMARSDPRGFLKQYPDGAILDEIQRVPELLSYIQVIVDQSEKKGLFILTGSHQFQLHQAISQSLAGRTALLTLLPMSLSELSQAGITLSIDDALLQGGYPRLFKEKLDPTITYRSYFQTYVERDLRQLAHIKDLTQFQKFVQLCAGRIGQLLNLESLSGDVGVSSNTLKEWLSLLEASFIIIRLQPYFENFGKRMIKSPKLYFTDVGLACHLLGIENTTQLARDPLRGNLFENLVLLELMKYRHNQALSPNLYFFRDTRGNEVDFIFQAGHRLIPIEIKAAQTYNASFLKNLSYFQDLTNDRAPTGYLIYGGTHEQTIGPFSILNYTHATLALSPNADPLPFTLPSEDT